MKTTATSLCFCNSTSLDAENSASSIVNFIGIQNFLFTMPNIVASILQIPKTAAYKKKTRTNSRHWRQQSYRLAKSKNKNDSPLTFHLGCQTFFNVASIR